MNTIKTINHQPAFASAPCAWIAIDDVPIEAWFAQALDYPDALTLGFAPMWLCDEDEERLACARLVPGVEGSSTVVPVLVCSDDMDFGCTVVVVEQLVCNGTVQWLRWGHCVSNRREVGISTIWKSTAVSPLATFDLAQFDACVRTFKR